MLSTAACASALGCWYTEKRNFYCPQATQLHRLSTHYNSSAAEVWKVHFEEFRTKYAPQCICSHGKDASLLREMSAFRDYMAIESALTTRCLLRTSDVQQLRGQAEATSSAARAA